MGRGSSKVGKGGGLSSKAGKSGAGAIGKMTKEKRQEFLDDAPVGTEIHGLYSKKSGMEVTIKKKEGYSVQFGTVIGTTAKLKQTWWEVNGSEEPYLSSELRKAADGTSKYYTTKKPHK